MRRSTFIHLACAMGTHAIGTPGDRQPHASHLVATARVVADELGLRDDATPALEAQGAGEEIRTLALQLEAAKEHGGKLARALELSAREVFDLKARIATLEADLEKATAPAAPRPPAPARAAR